MTTLILESVTGSGRLSDMGIIRWEEPPEVYETGASYLESIVEELGERADAFAVVAEGQPPTIAMAFAKELEMADYNIETEIVGTTVYARYRI